MTSLTNALLAPFAMIFRHAYARPWLAILISGALAVLAEVLHRDVVMAIFACFAAYMLIWMDESEHRKLVEIGAADNVE
jgi:hypothetical protein